MSKRELITLWLTSGTAFMFAGGLFVVIRQAYEVAVAYGFTPADACQGQITASEGMVVLASVIYVAVAAVVVFSVYTWRNITDRKGA